MHLNLIIIFVSAKIVDLSGPIITVVKQNILSRKHFRSVGTIWLFVGLSSPWC